MNLMPEKESWPLNLIGLSGILAGYSKLKFYLPKENNNNT
jgi:hypothetical protein